MNPVVFPYLQVRVQSGWSSDVVDTSGEEFVGTGSGRSLSEV
jgi:hypothetical protein